MCILIDEVTRFDKAGLSGPQLTKPVRDKAEIGLRCSREMLPFGQELIGYTPSSIMINLKETQ